MALVPMIFLHTLLLSIVSSYQKVRSFTLRGETVMRGAKRKRTLELSVNNY